MQTAHSPLSTRLATIARRNFGAFLPWSALTGTGRASELAAMHPAFSRTVEPETRPEA